MVQISNTENTQKNTIHAENHESGYDTLVSNNTIVNPGETALPDTGKVVKPRPAQSKQKEGNSTNDTAYSSPAFAHGLSTSRC